MALLIMYSSSLLYANYGTQSMSGPDCSSCTKIKLIFVTIWSGSCVTTTTSVNPLNGDITTTQTSTPCGKNGGSWDWFWE